VEEEFFVHSTCSLGTGKMLMGHLSCGEQLSSPHLHLLPSSIDPVILANIQLGTPSAKSNLWFPQGHIAHAMGACRSVVGAPQPVELCPYVAP